LEERNKALRQQIQNLSMENVGQVKKHEQDMQAHLAYKHQMDAKFKEFERLCKKDMNETMKRLM
jgi:hypothetical protein